MGDRPVVVAEPPAADTSARHSVCCEHAVFTSIRSAVGQGYRLIAASGGVRADEKVEITRRSASHGSLCETGPDPVGLSSYRLGSGRHCITYCCHAGREHTSRGGQRVYSHMVLLDPSSYRLFNSDPVRVHAALGEVVSRLGPLLKPPARLEPLSLDIPPTTVPFMEALGSLGGWPTSSEVGAQQRPRNHRNPRSEDLGHPIRLGHLIRGGVEPKRQSCTASDWIPAMAARLLGRRRLIFVGAQHPLWMIEWALLWLPRDVRESVDVSCGLKYSPARQMQLVLLPHADGQLRRLIAGQDIEFRCADAAPPPLLPNFEPWFRLLHRWWHEGRLSELVRLTSNVCADALAGATAVGAGIRAT